MAEVKTKTKKVETIDNANKTVAELRVELNKLRLDVKTGKEANTSLVKKLKREIARKLTVK